MDTAREVEQQRIGIDEAAGDALAGTELDAGGVDDTGVDDAMFDLGGDERRMHVRAYNYWVSLLKGRPYPRIDDLDPGNIADFGPHSVLIDFSVGIDDPAIAFLGRALREECGLEVSITRIADVPSRTLLSRLTDHYLQIIANRAPIGFEAEFVGNRGRTTLYRGILMPFSSDGEAIDFIYGVINWKEVVDDETQATLAAELDAAVRAAPKPPIDTAIWADGPSHGFDAAPEVEIAADLPAAQSFEPDPVLELHAGFALDPIPEAIPQPDTQPLPLALASPAGDDIGAPAFTPASPPALTGALGNQLMMARESAAAVRAADTRGRAALYRALGRAHDFGLACEADAAGYAALLAAAAIVVQPRAPLTPVVKLVFGADYDKTRLAEFAAVLAYARRHGVAAGGLTALLDGIEGGIKAVVAAERATKRPGQHAELYDRAAAELRALPALCSLALGVEGEEFVVLLARAASDGTVQVIKRVDGSKGFVEGLVRRAAG
ncbi:hypothetical protein [Sphingomonas sp. GC_Shp_5]|uniref:PAS domain-containing protein n=1 Tax=Sphingomonas sp. GC_Shp_5 TaxID=2937379 RepID=UPI00226A4736|nr:hypothetical protein [Sphingomonas sp. GC_Shp_5]